MPTRTPLTDAQREAFERHVAAFIPTPQQAVVPRMDGVLDQSVADLRAALTQIQDVTRLRALLADEQAGKTRKSAIAALNAAIAARTGG